MNQLQRESVFNILSKAGDAILDVYKSDDFDTELKSDNSPVTRADKASSKIINQGLKDLFPNTPILDEENTIPDYKLRRNWEYYFLVDPLDGTKEFIKKNGEFCINLALIKETKPIEGWIFQPLLGKGWYCKKGKGIYEFNKAGESKKIQQTKRELEVIRIAASRSFFKPREAELIDKIRKFYPVEIKHCGSSKKQVEMILGNADIYLKAGPCSEWDTAPGHLMIEEFGGLVFRQDNFGAMTYNKPKSINPHFIMLNSNLNQANFISFLKNIIQE